MLILFQIWVYDESGWNEWYPGIRSFRCADFINPREHNGNVMAMNQKGSNPQWMIMDNIEYIMEWMECRDGISNQSKSRSVCFVSILCSQRQRRDVATSTPTPMSSSGFISIHPLRRAKNVKARSFWDFLSLSARHERLLLIFVSVFAVYSGYQYVDVLQDAPSFFMNLKPNVNVHLFLFLSLSQCVFDIWILFCVSNLFVDFVWNIWLLFSIDYQWITGSVECTLS